MAWVQISDARITAGKPVTGRYARTLRNNTRLAGTWPMLPHGINGATASASGSWTTVFTLPIRVPVGGDLAELVLRLDLAIALLSAGSCTIEYRVTDGTNVSNVETLSATNPGSPTPGATRDFTLTLATAGAVGILAQVRLQTGDTPDAASLEWDTANGSPSYQRMVP